VTADLHGLSAVTLLRRHELDAAVAVPMVVPVDKRHHPLAGLVFAGKWPSRCCVSPRWSGEQLLEPLLRRSVAEG